jgi:peptidoglycan/LPS O-acetylase OafA/YrhL
MVKSTGLRFHFIDELRGIAALLVVLFHVQAGKHIDAFLETLTPALSAVFRHGDTGVSVFFVLSGFVVAHTLSPRPATFQNTVQFLVRRMIRLVPPYWAGIALAIVMAGLGAFVLKRPLEVPLDAGNLAAHLVFMQNILGYPEYNQVFWTLCTEVQYYAFAAFAMLAIGYKGEESWTSQRMIFAGFILFIITVPWAIGVGPVFTGFPFFSVLQFFVLGSGAYWAWRAPRTLPIFAAYWLFLAFAAFFSADPMGKVAVVTGAVVFWAASNSEYLQVGGWKPLQLIGSVSYSLYIVHNPLIGAVFRTGYLLLPRTAATECVMLAVAVMVCVFVAYLMWWLIEVPSIWLSRKYGGTPQ